MRGKMQAFGSFRDVLAQNMTTAMPELKDDVDRVLEATGGAKRGGTVSAASSMTTGAGATTATATTGEQRNGTEENGTGVGAGAASEPSAMR